MLSPSTSAIPDSKELARSTKESLRPLKSLWFSLPEMARKQQVFMLFRTNDFATKRKKLTIIKDAKAETIADLPEKIRYMFDLCIPELRSENISILADTSPDASSNNNNNNKNTNKNIPPLIQLLDRIANGTHNKPDFFGGASAMCSGTENAQFKGLVDSIYETMLDYRTNMLARFSKTLIEKIMALVNEINSSAESLLAENDARLDDLKKQILELREELRRSDPTLTEEQLDEMMAMMDEEEDDDDDYDTWAMDDPQLAALLLFGRNRGGQQDNKTKPNKAAPVPAPTKTASTPTRTPTSNNINNKNGQRRQQQQQQQKKPYTCNVCGVHSTLICVGCRSVYYCGVEHQKVDWPTHKTLCKKKYAQ